jgi:hypothetical protein
VFEALRRSPRLSNRGREETDAYWDRRGTSPDETRGRALLGGHGRRSSSAFEVDTHTLS